MSKEIILGSQARDTLKRGVDALTNAVKVTLGPKGRNVALAKNNTAPAITKDGVSVAKEIELDHPGENLGAQMIKEVASITADRAGDGTTTSSVLAQAIIKIGLKNVTAGANPMELKKGIDKAVVKVVAHLKKQAKQIEDDISLIQQVATICANGDSSIGKLIARAMKKTGKDGVINVEEANGTESTIKNVEGIQIDSGYLSPYFITNAEKLSVELENAYLLFFDGEISNIQDLLPVLEMAAQSGNTLLIIAKGIKEDILTTLVVNKIRGSLNIAVIKAPGFAGQRTERLEDIATLTGGIVISEDKGLLLKNVTLTDLGNAERIIINKNQATIVNGNGEKKDINNRIKLIRLHIKHASSKNEKELLRERLAKLSGGIAILSIGAATELEMKEKKDRVDDALNATKAAIEEGVIPGGGVAYIRSISILDNLKGENEDQNIGISIIKRAMEQPLRQIVQNAGVEGAIIIEKVKRGKKNYGYNAQNEKFENLFLSGIIDPVKVVRIALENAASIAGLLLMTEGVIFKKSPLKK